MIQVQAKDCFESPQGPLSVHTLPTSGRFPAPPRDIADNAPPPPTPTELRRRHYCNEIPAVESAYTAYDIARGTDRFARFLDCRTIFRIFYDTAAETCFDVTNACGLRWCPLCAESRAAFLSHEVRAWYESALQPRLLTLTLRHNTSPLEDQLQLLTRAARKLRRAKFFTSAVRGGIWFLQVTWSDRTNAWHPHIHALIDARFIPHALLKARWAKVTGGSDIVHIKSCYSPGSAAHHVSRYATRPGTLSSVPDDRRLELVEALDGKRIVGTWGSAKVVSLVPRKTRDMDHCIELGTWDELHVKARDSFPARCALLSRATGFKVTRSIINQLFEQPVYPNPRLKDRFGCEYLKSSIWDPL